MTSESESHPNAVPAVTASRFDRNGETVFNLALRVTGSPGAAWHAAVAAFAAVAERVPPDAPEGTDDRDLLLMGCWHARQMLGQLEANPEYAAQLHAHDEAQPPLTGLQGAVSRANLLLPVDQREVLALRGLSTLDHADLAVLLRADPGLLAAMLAQARLMLHDAMHGSQITGPALEDPEDRQPIALAALRQDGQLRGAEARLMLATWLEGGDTRQVVIDALEEAGLAYRAWEPVPVPDGLGDAVIVAVGGVAPAAPADAGSHTPQASTAAAGAAAAAASGPDDEEGIPAGEHDRPVAPVDPNATVEWSSSDIAALGLDGGPAAPDAGVSPVGGTRPAATPAPAPRTVVTPAAAGGGGGGRTVPPDDGDDDQWDDGWEGDTPGEGFRTPDTEQRRSAPRWQIALVGILLVAVIVVLVLTFTKGDDPTPARTTPTPTTTTTKKKSTKTSTSKTKTTGAVPTATERVSYRVRTTVGPVV